jgi:hypothetical protein
LVTQAAEMLLDGSELRDMNNANDTFIKKYLYAKYLPLASHTQFVKAGIKEAKNISPTD